MICNKLQRNPWIVKSWNTSGLSKLCLRKQLLGRKIMKNVPRQLAPADHTDKKMLQWTASNYEYDNVQNQTIDLACQTRESLQWSTSGRYARYIDLKMYWFWSARGALHETLRIRIDVALTLTWTATGKFSFFKCNLISQYTSWRTEGIVRARRTKSRRKKAKASWPENHVFNSERS